MNKDTFKEMFDLDNFIDWLSTETDIRNFWFYFAAIGSSITVEVWNFYYVLIAWLLFAIIEYYTMLDYGFVGTNE